MNRSARQGASDSLKLWPYLCDKQLSAIYMSGYQRTRQTVAYVAEQSGLIPVVDERLNEIDNGLIEGMTDAAMQEQYPDVWRGFRERAADFRFPGEKRARRRASVLPVSSKKNDRSMQMKILFVSHEGLIRLLVCHILGLPVYARWNFQVGFCGIMEIAYQTDLRTWKLLRFNQTVN